MSKVKDYRRNMLLFKTIYTDRIRKRKCFIGNPHLLWWIEAGIITDDSLSDDEALYTVAQGFCFGGKGKITRSNGKRYYVVKVWKR